MALRYEEKEKMKENLRREIAKLEARLEEHGECNCDRCLKLIDEIEQLEARLEDIDTPSSCEYIPEWLGI